MSARDRVNSRTGVLEEAKLDVATRDAATGRKIYVDTKVTCAHGGYEPSRQACAGKDGAAAAPPVIGEGLPCEGERHFHEALLCELRGGGAKAVQAARGSTWK